MKFLVYGPNYRENNMLFDFNPVEEQQNPFLVKIDSQIKTGGSVQDFSQEQVKNEPMLFNCDLTTALKLGGPITKDFIQKLNDVFLEDESLIFDSRVHMLMPGWYPCIPGWHHDDVPRDRPDGQPEYYKPSYKAKHCLCIVGDASKTEFAIGKDEFEPPLVDVVYKSLHPIVENKVRGGQLKSIFAVPNQLIYFDWNTWHQGTKATKNGWRFFIRATINTKRKPTNELRRQTQVYLEFPMEGW